MAESAEECPLCTRFRPYVRLIGAAWLLSGFVCLVAILMVGTPESPGRWLLDAFALALAAFLIVGGFGFPGMWRRAEAILHPAERDI